MDRPMTANVRMVGRRLEWSCLVCNHPVSAMSVDGVQAAMDAHAEYINKTVDRATDEHFAEVRLNALLAD
jgi:hypothetical protein